MNVLEYFLSHVRLYDGRNGEKSSTALRTQCDIDLPYVEKDRDRSFRICIGSVFAD